MTPQEIKKLSRNVGIVIDQQFPRKDVAYHLISQLKPGSIVVTPSGGGLEAVIRETVLLRGNLHLREFHVTQHELTYMSSNKASEIQDYLFLSYLKKTKGHLIIFPWKYTSKVKGGAQQYARRVQDMIINAYTMDVNTTIVRPEDVVDAPKKEK